LKIRSSIDFLEDVARLVNQDRINNDYICVRIKCDIAYMGKMFIYKNPSYTRNTKEIITYLREHKDAECLDTPPKSN
jgi:hypothetical protein